MIIRKKNTFIKYGYASWHALFHFNFQGQKRRRSIFRGISNLIVLNDDTFGNDFEFSRHRHEQFAIMTYVVDGELEHNDTIEGKNQKLQTGDFQIINSGTGMSHSETPLSPTVTAMQIWFLPNKIGVAPNYLFIPRKNYSEDGSWMIDDKQINADVKVAVNFFDEALTLSTQGRVLYICIIKGAVSIGRKQVTKHDAIIAVNETITLLPSEPTKVLILSLQEL